MNLQTFLQQYGTEKKCLDHLFHLRWEYGYRCPRCECDEMWEVKDYKYKCRNCDYQTTVTAGTLFHNTHLPMTSWFRAVWYMSAQTEKKTAIGLQKELNLSSYSTALSIFRKLQSAMIRPVLCRLKGVIEIMTTSIVHHNHKKTIAIAVEINNRKIGRIRIGEIKDMFAALKYFVGNIAEPGSEILCEKLHDYIWLGENGYTEVSKHSEYSFPYAAKIKEKIIIELRKPSRIDSLEERLNDFCIRFNGPRTEITFDELLRNAMHMPPHHHSKRT